MPPKINGLIILKDGAAACVISSEAFVHAHSLENQAIKIVANVFTTDGVTTFEGRSAMDVVRYAMRPMTKACVSLCRPGVQGCFAEGQGRHIRSASSSFTTAWRRK